VEFIPEFAFGVALLGWPSCVFTGPVLPFAAGAVELVGGFTTPLLGVEDRGAFAVDPSLCGWTGRFPPGGPTAAAVPGGAAAVWAVAVLMPAKVRTNVAMITDSVREWNRYFI
jgi:hypothetical protein